MLSEEEFRALRRLRQLDSYSQHLTLINLGNRNRLHKRITDWIWANLSGRFWVGDLYLDRQWNFYVGFEQESEASYFALKFLSVLDQE